MVGKNYNNNYRNAKRNKINIGLRTEFKSIHLIDDRKCK